MNTILHQTARSSSWTDEYSTNLPVDGVKIE